MKSLMQLLFLGVLITILTSGQYRSNIRTDIEEKESSRSIIAPHAESTQWGEAESLNVLYKDRNLSEILRMSRMRTPGNTMNPGGSLKPGSVPGANWQNTGMTSDLAEEGVLDYIIPLKTDGNQVRFKELDEHAGSAPSPKKTEMDEMVKYLVQPCGNEMEKARVIFSWIALNVVYDDDGFNSGRYGDNTAENVYKIRKAVCQGYSDLFQGMGKLGGLEAEMVFGYSKGLGYRPGQPIERADHAWNAVRIQGEWKLFDVTWASGYGTVEKGKLVSISKYDDYWFDTPAEEFIFSHLPEDPKWQLTEINISKRQFEDLPGASSSYFKLGFDGESCFGDAIEGSLKTFPQTYVNDGSVQAVSLPYNGTINAGNRMMIILESNKAESIAVVNNGKWFLLNKEGNEFGAIIEPTPGQLTVNANFDRSSNRYSTLLAYTVQ